MPLRNMAVVAAEPPADDVENPGEALLERIRFGLEALGHAVGPALDEAYCWLAEVEVEGHGCELRVGWTGDEWLVTYDPPPVGPFPRLRRWLGGDDPIARSERIGHRFARDLHTVLAALGPVRWFTPDDHRPGVPGAETPDA